MLTPGRSRVGVGKRGLCLLATLATFVLATSAEAGWYNPAWLFRKAIVLNGGLVTAAQTNFPVLVSLTDASGLGANAQASGNDILFTASDGTTKLDHQIEAYTSPAGTLVAWVRIPALASPANTTIFMYYGNAAAASQQNATGVWDANFKAVWHLSSDFLDSTSNANNAANTGSVNVAARAANGQSFNGTSGNINDGSNASIDNVFATGGTAEAWIDPAACGENAFGRVFDKGHVSGWSLFLDCAPAEGTNTLSFLHGSSTGPTFGQWLTADNTIQYSQWQHVAVTFNSGNINNTPTLYINGVAMASTERITPSGVFVSDAASTLMTGNRPADDRTFDGIIDEPRISNTVRSASWIQTEYNNVSNPGVGAGKFILSLGPVQTTAVTLLSFGARGLPSGVELTWQTGAEVNNLGFNLYRAERAEGPYQRITPSVIPGLGSSAQGASYRWQDSGPGLVNGLTYFYELEDIETTGRTEMHGPVSAVPQPGSPGGVPRDAGSGAPSPAATRRAYGDPSSVSLQVLERSEQHVLLELRTGGFYAVSGPDGSVVFEIPGLEQVLESGLPALPVKRASVDAVVGKGVRLGRVSAERVSTYSGLVPALSGSLEWSAGADGVVTAHLRRHGRAGLMSPGLFPASAARVAGTLFQGEQKKALIELWPLRWNASTSQVELSGRLLVRLEFAGREDGESSRGGATRGRRAPRGKRATDGLLASLVARERGLYAVAFEDLFGAGRRSLAAGDLRLFRQGEPVAFHLEPGGSDFGPGSVLYFFSEGAALNPYGNEAVYQLSIGREGSLAMPLVSAFPSGGAVSSGWAVGRWEENKTYQPGLLSAPDLWLWESLIAPARKTHGFALPGLLDTGEPSRLEVFLQGGSDQEGVADHHLRVRVNGTTVGETTWDGMTAQTLSAAVAPGILHEADNLLELESLGDAGASYSLTFLDRFTVAYPRALATPAGSLDVGFSRSGMAEVSGLGADGWLLDVTSPEAPRWLFGASPTAGGMALRIEADRRYLALARAKVPRPEVRLPLASTLRRTTNRADYLLIAPRAFLAAAQPLLDLRASQGLAVQAAALDEVYQEFGYGETTPQAIRDFIAYAYHSWRSPSPRYVVLLGDASYDYKNVLGLSATNPVPPLLVKTSFLWTVSDPTYAAVNGDDLVPDLALGRLPAGNLAEAQALVEKIVAFETAGRTLADGAAVLVADNPDGAGDFEASARQAGALLAGTYTVENVFLSELQGGTRPTIVAAFDRGASLVSYLGHGGTAVWASENIFNNQDVTTLAPQAQQPLVLTMDCLNGYFHFPFLNSLAEELVKARGKGAIASFAPSGLSLHAPADLFHQALLRQVASGAHERLGDAIFAAQVDYAGTGAFPELLSVYQLLGDPALKIR